MFAETNKKPAKSISAANNNLMIVFFNYDLILFNK